jgi:hypothetical protein
MRKSVGQRIPEKEIANFQFAYFIKRHILKLTQKEMLE